MKEEFQIITRSQKVYPYMLAQIPDAPEKLYIKGEILPQDDTAVAIVGSRRSTLQGQQIAYNLAFELASHGLTIVSGLAQGIDAKAHEGALAAGGRTIAVLGTGINIVFPEINRALFSKIPKQGALVTEFTPNTPALKPHFPQRNRIISGLSLGTLVVEARERSGALITARLALEQNREVWAVPGSFFSQTSRGSNLLIQSGAKLITCTKDILEELKIDDKNHKEPISAKLNLSPEEEKVFNSLQNEPQDLHNLIVNTNLEAKTINSAISLLELKGLIKAVGNNFILNK